ncbi:hypothetical protein SEER_01135 [Salmonella enterica subsp. enterica serovar Rissen str. 150]|nr:hypothetical protein SEER_01135 [Salmonella enterica subsp. enterica serovar Rissen str. 150]KMJ42559.1 hypothetical protein ABT74_06205 [Salmonella enterica subsp. enterica serovar Typhimurium]
MQNRRFKNQSLMKNNFFERARILLSFHFNLGQNTPLAKNDTNRRFNTRRLFFCFKHIIQYQEAGLRTG